jgi:hypothetical protein
MNDLPPLPDDVRALLERAHKGAPPPPAGAQAAILAKVTASAALPAALALKPVLALAFAAVVAGSVVVAIHARTLANANANVTVTAKTPAPVPPDVVAPVVAPVVVAPIIEPVAPVAPVAPVVPVVAPVASTAKARPPSVSDEPRPSEEALLEEARDALARGDGDVALAKLEEHAHDYATGKLSEERRALTVVAYGQRGDKARAAASAKAFEHQYPSSLFLETVRAAVQP